MNTGRPAAPEQARHPWTSGCLERPPRFSGWGRPDRDNEATRITVSLIAAGAEIDAQNRFGATPLSVAVFNSMGRGEAMQLLLDAGADPDRRNSAGISPRAGAERIANYDVAKYFEGR